MSKPTENRPGVREAHLLRKRNNPLFPAEARDVGPDELATARLQDGLEMDRFMEEFQALVQRAVALEPNTPSETILAIKEELDHSYQKACALPGDQSAVKAAIRKLLAVIMGAIGAGIGNDAYAARQLEEEALARETHFALQELPLVAALTHAESPVTAEELIPCLLTEDDDRLVQTLALFDAQQMATLCQQAEDWLQKLDADRQLPDAWRRLELLNAHFRQVREPPSGQAN